MTIDINLVVSISHVGARGRFKGFVEMTSKLIQT